MISGETTIPQRGEAVGCGPQDDNVAARETVPAQAPRNTDGRMFVIVVLLLLGVYLTTMGGHTVSVDGETYLAGTRALVRGTTVIERTEDMDGVLVLWPNKNGDWTTIAPIGTLLLFVPGFIAGKIVSLGFPMEFREEALRLVYLASNSVMTAITGGLLYLLCRRLGARTRHAFLLAMVFGLATWAWAHGETDFSEPGTALVLTCAMLALTRWWRLATPRNAALVGFLAGCVVLTRSTTAFFVPVFLLSGLYGVRKGLRLRQLVAFGLGGLIPGVVFATNAMVRFGSPFDLGYPSLKFDTPFYEGLFGLIVSPGKGLIFYAPVALVVILALRSSYLADRRLVVTVGVIIALHLSIFARFEVWSGEVAYGPRYLVPLLPLIICLLAPVISVERRWARGVALAGVVGFIGPGILGATIEFQGAYFYNAAGTANNLDNPAPSWEEVGVAWEFQPRSSPLMQNLRSVPKMLDNVSARFRGETTTESVPVNYEDRIHWYARTVQVDTWWSWWPLIGGPRRVFLLAFFPLGCLLAGLTLLGREVRLWRRTT